MPQLVRAWESQYLPQATGGIVRLRRASEFRRIEASDGITDPYEGLRRTTLKGNVSCESDDDQKIGHWLRDLPIDVRIRHADHLIEGDQIIELREVRAGEKRAYEYDIDITDRIGEVPYLLCFSLLPKNPDQWRELVSSLSAEDKEWTCSTDVSCLKFEVEWGIKRWLATKQVREHRIQSAWGPVKYLTDDKPVSQTSKELLNVGDAIIGRWFRKVNMYRHQREYRFAYIIESEELSDMPPWIDIELTKTGIALFQPFEAQL
ncbi:MAG: hypothetical protein OXG55_16830 [bacterium]|nr:hypothetical protein [bacterium]